MAWFGAAGQSFHVSMELSRAACAPASGGECREVVPSSHAIYIVEVRADGERTRVGEARLGAAG